MHSFHLYIAPSSAPANLFADNITSSAISFSWDVIPDENQNGIIRYYQVNLTETDTGTDSTWIAYTNGLTVQDLHPYYTYQVSVAAYTVDVGPYSATASYQMKEDGIIKHVLFKLFNKFSIL